MQSENAAGAETTETSEAPTETQNLRDLLDIVEPSDDSGESQQDADGSHNAAPVKFNDLADKLGMELDDLYKLEVSQSSDGEPITVEAMKDFYAKQDELTLQQIEREERRTEQEAELTRAQTELREIMQALPENAIKPEILQKVRDKHAATVALEQQRTLAAIPEWNDEATRTAEIEGIAKHLEQFGFPADYLANVVDHRQMKFMRESWRRETRIREALARVRPGKPNPAPRSKPANKPPSKNALADIQRGNSPNRLHAAFSQLKD